MPALLLLGALGPGTRPAQATPRLVQVTNPGIDLLRTGTPRLVVGRFDCDGRQPGCRADDVVLVSGGIAAEATPSTWQAEALLVGGAGGLRFDPQRLYPPGLDLEDPYTAYRFGLSRGGCAGELDGDGFDELVVVNARGPHRLYRSAGDGRLRDATADLHELDADGEELDATLARLIARPTAPLGERSIAHSRGRPAAAAWPRWQAYAEAHNTRAAACTVADVDGDGLADVLVHHLGVTTTRMLGGTPAERRVRPLRTLQLFLNGRNGKAGEFLDVSRGLAPTVDAFPELGAVGALALLDLDGDRRPELVAGCSSKAGGPCQGVVLGQQESLRFTRRQSLPAASPVVALLPLRVGERRWLLQVERSSPPRLFELQGGGLHERGPAAPTAGALPSPLAGAALGDLDGDSLPELLLAGRQGLALLRGVAQGPGGIAWVPAAAEALAIGALQGRAFSDVALLDVDGDGRLEAVLAGTGFSWLLHATPGGGLTLRSALPPGGSQEGSGEIVDLDGDGRAELLLPAQRRFDGEPRALVDRLLRFDPAQAGFVPWPAPLPQAKLDNLAQCQREGLPGRHCDRPASCLRRCAAACGAGPELTERCRAGCSQAALRAELYGPALRQGRRVLCAGQTTKTRRETGPDPAWSEQFLPALTRAAAEAKLALDGLCRTPEAAPALDDPRWQLVFDVLASLAGDRGPVPKGWGRALGEETLALLPVRRGQRRFLFSQYQFQPPELSELGPDGRWLPVDPARLPCALQRDRLAATVGDLDGDGRDDLLLPAAHGLRQLTIWQAEPETVPAGPLFRREERTVRFAGAPPAKLYRLLVGRPAAPGTAAPLLALTSGGPYLLRASGADGYQASAPQDVQGRALGPWCRRAEGAGGRVDFGPCPAGPVPGSWRSGALGDVDGDGRDDLVLGALSSAAEVRAAHRRGEPAATSRAAALWLARGGPGELRFADASAALAYDLRSGRDGRYLARHAQQQTLDVDLADLDGDGDLDLLLTDFESPVYLENLGRDCWLGGEPARCLVDRTLALFGQGAAFDGKYGAKDYASELADVDGDGRLDLLLHTALDDLLYLQRAPRSPD